MQECGGSKREIDKLKEYLEEKERQIYLFKREVKTTKG